MPVRKANAVWQGGLKDGSGEMELSSGAYRGAYSFTSRFEEGTGTNPEELIAAAHAGCFSMAFSADLERAGFTPKRVQTTASVTVERVEGAWTISKILLNTEAEVPGISEERFQQIAEGAKGGCPVSRVLRAEITLSAKLVG
jgi:osmotically inducible protein OsmC